MPRHEPKCRTATEKHSATVEADGLPQLGKTRGPSEEEISAVESFLASVRPRATNLAGHLGDRRRKGLSIDKDRVEKETGLLRYMLSPICGELSPESLDLLARRGVSKDALFAVLMFDDKLRDRLDALFEKAVEVNEFIQRGKYPTERMLTEYGSCATDLSAEKTAALFDEWREFDGRIRGGGPGAAGPARIPVMAHDDSDSDILRRLARAFDRLDKQADKVQADWPSPEYEKLTGPVRRTAKAVLDLAADNLAVVNRAVSDYGCPLALEGVVALVREYAAERWPVDGKHFHRLQGELTVHQRREPPSLSFADLLRHWADKTRRTAPPSAPPVGATAQGEKAEGKARDWDAIGRRQRLADTIGTRNGGAGKPIAQCFAFGPGQVLFRGTDLDLPTGLAVEVMERLTRSFGRTVPYSKLDTNSEPGQASEQLRGAVRTIRNALTTHCVPCEIKVKIREGYVIQAAKTPRAPRRKPRRK